MKSLFKRLNTSGHFPDFFHKAKSQRDNKKIRSRKERRLLKERQKGSEVEMSNKDILSILNGQPSASTYAFNPETLAFRNKVIELQKNCPAIEWEQDMGATVPYCKLDNTLCNGQCSFRTDDCPCDTDRR